MNQCVKCGKPLAWGEFAYNQEVCIDCFKQEVATIQDNIDIYYPSWLKDKKEEHKDNIVLMISYVFHTISRK